MKESNTQLLSFGLVVFFLSLAFGQLQRIEITSQVALYYHEAILGFLICWFFPQLKEQYREFGRRVVREKPVLLLLAYLFVQTIVLQFIKPDIISFLYCLRLLFYAQTFILVKLAVNRHYVNRQIFFQLIQALSWVIAVLGLFQYLFIPDTRFLFWLGWDDHYYRVISTLFDPNFTGLIISTGLIIYILQTFTLRSFIHRFTFIFPSVLALLFTYSRASYLASIATIAMVVLLKKKISFGLIIIAIVVSIPLLPRPGGEGVKLERTASIFSRMTSNQLTLQSLSFTEVLFGRGLFTQLTPSHNGLPNHAVAPDNSFIFLFISLGIIGSSLLVLSTVLYKNLIFASPLRETLLLVSIHGLFNNSLFYIWTMVILWTLLAIQPKIKA